LTLDHLLQFEPALIGLVLFGLALGVWLALRVVRLLDRRARQRRAVRAQLAERQAEQLLQSSGYEVLGRQVRRSWSVLVDGRELGFELIADYVVRAGGQDWVAEVKTGERALDLRHAPTRRQLLEYREAFGATGVLLVDAEGRRVQRVLFRDAEPGTRARRGRRKALLLGFSLGAAAGALLALTWFWTARALALPPWWSFEALQPQLRDLVADQAEAKQRDTGQERQHGGDRDALAIEQIGDGPEAAADHEKERQR
jgi:hypothetical protein